MLLSELNVTYGYNTSGFHSRGNHRDLLVLGRMLMGTIEKKSVNMFSTTLRSWCSYSELTIFF